MAAYRQPDNLRKLLCSSKLYPVSRGDKYQRISHTNAPGWKRCGKNCKICPYTFKNTKEITGTASKYKHVINEHVSCESENLIYYWKCIKTNCPDFPNCEYIGKTTRKFKDRFGEHRNYVKGNVETEPAGKHFNSRGHDVSHLQGLVIEKVNSSDPFILKAREHLLIQKFNTFKSGLNKEA